jgi:hypothetical protein
MSGSESGSCESRKLNDSGLRSDDAYRHQTRQALTKIRAISDCRWPRTVDRGQSRRCHDVGLSLPAEWSPSTGPIGAVSRSIAGRGAREAARSGKTSCPWEVPAIEKTAHKVGLSARSTVAQFSERFMEDRVKPVRKNTKQIERYFRKQIIPEIGSQKIADVTPQQILAITDRLKGYGSPMAALEVRNLLKRLFAYAMARQPATFNPAAAIPGSSIATPKARDRVLSTAEIHTYLDKLYRSDIARRYAISLHLRSRGFDWQTLAQTTQTRGVVR